MHLPFPDRELCRARPDPLSGKVDGRRALRLLSRLPLLVAGLFGAFQDAAAMGNATTSYKVTTTRTLSLHHYRPGGWEPGRGLPAILLFHGGAWQSANVAQFEPQAKHYRDLGMVAVLAEYRVQLIDGSFVEDSIRDARSAMRYLKANAWVLGIDPARIVAAGGSAGGHLALGCAMFTGFDEPGDDPGLDPLPCAVVGFNPVTDTSAPDGYGTHLYLDKPHLGSPVDRVVAGLPPSLILHGDADTTIPLGFAQALAGRLQLAGNRCDLLVYPGVGHGFFNNEPYRTSTLNATDAFLADLGLLPARGWSGLERWRFEHFGDSTGIGAAADLADPDRDGLGNLAEFVLGGRPLLPDPALWTAVFRGQTADVTFAHRPDSAIVIELQRSADAAAWDPIAMWSAGAWSGLLPTESVSEGVLRRVTWRVAIPGAGTRGFFRLQLRSAVP